MLTSPKLRGVIPAIVTPFDEQDRIDERALRRITDYVVEGGVHAIMTTGGTGEFPHLLQRERREVTRIVVDQARGRVPVIAGTAACSTKETLTLTNDAREAGAAAAIVTAPYYFTLPQAALFRHFEQIACGAAVPIVVYNNPTYTGNNLSPALLAELAQVDGIIGLKQSNADMGQLVEVIRLAGDRFSILTGIDSQFYPSLSVGARGVFSTAACVIPRQMAQVYDRYLAGRADEALKLHLQLQALNRFLEYDPGYVAPCKEALNLLGLPGGRVRSPLPGVTDEERAGIRDALARLGLLLNSAGYSTT